MKYKVQRSFSNLDGWSYRNFDDLLGKLIHEMRDRVGHSFIGEYNNLRFVMNVPFYNEFFIACQMAGKNSEWCRGVKIIEDPTLYVSTSMGGIVRLIYEESEVKRYSRYYDFWTDQSKIKNALGFPDELYYSSVRKGTPNFGYDVLCLNRHGFQRVPHIDHVKFNGPATIVFWKDGTKTVVKHDGKGRKDKRMAILYAFIRKIYGEGKPYHNILNEIEEAIK